jgi:multicomponent K+:H+ antiporter subunit D
MNVALPHMIVVPVVLPLVAAALILVLGDRRPRLRSILGCGAALANLVVVLEIYERVDTSAASGAIGVYLASNWESPFGIALVADRLTALMLVLAGVVGLCAAVYATATWSRVGVHFQALFQIQLMGINGAFLTGDLFNLFVFFEVMLAASYGLQLHGSGWPRVRSGLHYIAVNLLASALFLIGLAMIFGVMGTLSMADIAAKLPHVAQTDRGLLHAGAAILAMAFLTKAAIWPLNFWLVPAYAAASAPVAALFALMTKVGIYTLLRLWTLLFSAGAGPSASFGAQVLLYGGLVTMAFGALGVMASLRLGHIGGFSIIVSSGTLLAAIGLGAVSVTSAALFYLLGATLAASALFLLIELIERTAGERASPLDADASDRSYADFEADEDTNLDDNEVPLVGRVIPVSIALLGLGFIACASIIAGLPPLSSFVAKVALMTALLSPQGLGQGSAVAPSLAVWSFVALLLLSGLVTTIAMARAGIRYFWSAAGRTPPRVKLAEGAPVLALLLACTWLALRAEPLMRYTTAVAEALHTPTAYIDAVMSTKPVPGPTRPAFDGKIRP